MSNYTFPFLLAGSFMTVLFLFSVNLATTPGEWWFLFPTVVVLLLPFFFHSRQKGYYPIYTWTASLTIMIYLFVENMTTSPHHPWFLYVSYVFVLWILSAHFERHLKKLSFACLISLLTIGYYTLLNVVISPHFPWAIFPAFVILWWPLALYCSQQNRFFLFSVLATILTALFFILLNAVTTPETIWAIYPIFAMLWWPLSMYFYSYKVIKL
ncbi:hypothetical protein M3212_03020 [Alkalihalobacillus oceani]|uniref:hypothetical protein n=1 Tax=Halalkalibacter oceani TaxID=1653776 RepID=UPI00203C113C|nr:hypothetical protein [Halalkalibacter oceani]MCM3759755.1 hypothetical protein [Halalkalibacter oceani]